MQVLLSNDDGVVAAEYSAESYRLLNQVVYCAVYKKESHGVVVLAEDSRGVEQ